jgi:hypothetical protein
MQAAEAGQMLVNSVSARIASGASTLEQGR